MFKGLVQIYNLLDKKNRYKIFLFAFLLFIASIFEGLSFGAIYPLIKLSMSSDLLIKINTFLDDFGISYKFEHKEILYFLSIFIFSTFLLRFLFSIYFAWWKSIFLHTLSTNLSNKLYKSLIRENYNFFKENNTSVLIRSFFYDITILIKALNSSLKMLLELFTLLVISIILIFLAPKIIISIGVLFYLVFFLLNKLFSYKIKFWADKKQSFTSKLISSLQETYGKIKNILIDQNFNFFEQNYNEKIKKFNHFSQRLMFVQELPRPILELISLTLIIIIFLIYNYIGKIENFLPLLAILGVAIIRIVPAVSRITSLRQALISFIPSINSLKELYRLQNFLSTEELENKSKNVIFNNSIELRGIYFKYPNERKYLLKNFNLKINKFDYLYIYGKSGSGKTTLLDIFLGLSEPEKGELLIDDIKYDFKNPNWKKLISYVPQNTYLLDDSIINNIIYGEKFDEKKFFSVIKDSQISSLIESLPNKENTIVGENGSLISAGEKQRIGIARALYLSKDILVCDEITSSLDKKTSDEIISTLKSISKKKTIIFVSHDQKAINETNKKIEILKNY